MLKNEKIVYYADSISWGIYDNGGYAQMIVDSTGSKMINFAIGGGI